MALFTINYYSTILGHDTEVVVVLPDHKDISDFTPQPVKYDVLYLLHGMGDNASGWLRYSNVERYANTFNFMVVMPTAEHSFYTNAIHEKKWGDFFEQELPYHIAQWFPVSDNRYIAGLSMGGYGALKLAFNRPNYFKGAAGLSSVLSLNAFKEAAPRHLLPTIEQIYRTIYNTTEPTDDIQAMLPQLNPNNLPLILQFVGTEDFLYQDNQDFKDKMSALNLPYHYEEWQGGHDWDFWDKAIYKTMTYFRQGVAIND